MKETVSSCHFADVMVRHGFTRVGALALFELLEALEDVMGRELELDPESFSRDYREYPSIKEAAADFYGYEEAEAMSSAEAYDRLLDDGGKPYPILRHGRHWGYIVQTR